MTIEPTPPEGTPSDVPPSPPQTSAAALVAFLLTLAGIEQTKREGAALAPHILAAAADLGEVCPEIADFRGALKLNGVAAGPWLRAVRDVRAKRDVERRVSAEAASKAAHVSEVQTRAKAVARPRLAPLVRLIDGTDPESQLAASEHLVGYHADELRFAKGLGWLAWDGTRWAQDDARAAERAKHTLRRMFLQAADDAIAAAEDYAVAVAACDDDGQRKAAGMRKRAESRMKSATQAQTAKGIAAILTLAATDKRIRLELDELDADPFVLNVQNGTIDLRTGDLRPHAPADLITKIGRVAWDPAEDDSDEVWHGFLRATTLSDEPLIAYMRKSAGYCLTGDTSQEVLFLLHGPPGSGKGTYENALACILGDYATTTSFDTWTHKPAAQAQRPDLAALVGARFVSCSEASAERRLDEGVISNATGGDRVNACHKYKDPFTYLPKYKLALLLNKPPRINDVVDETGIWRRLKKIPFENKVTGAEKNTDLKPYFRDPLRGGPAVLRWAVAGAVEYMRDRKLREPERVSVATEELRQENNPVRDFLAATCVIETNPARRRDSWISSAKLRAVYEQWAKDEGIKLLLDAKGMGKRLRDEPYHCEAGKAGTVRVWFGIRERTTADDAVDAAVDEEAAARRLWDAAEAERLNRG